MEELADRISARELAEWAAFERWFGPLTVQERLDAACAIVAWSIARALGGARTGDPGAFLPGWPRWAEASGARDRGQSVEDMIAVVRRIQRRHRGGSE